MLHLQEVQSVVEERSKGVKEPPQAPNNLKPPFAPWLKVTLRETEKCPMKSRIHVRKRSYSLQPLFSVPMITYGRSWRSLQTKRPLGSWRTLKRNSYSHQFISHHKHTHTLIPHTHIISHTYHTHTHTHTHSLSLSQIPHTHTNTHMKSTKFKEEYLQTCTLSNNAKEPRTKCD